MAIAKNPLRRDYFVYTMAAAGQSFYVGVGRSARASDRVRYVRYVLNRENSGRPTKWVLSNAVIAQLLRGGVDVKAKVIRPGLNRIQALAEERKVISWFQQRGVVLANRQHNGGSALSVQAVVIDIKRRIERKGNKLSGMTPNPSIQRGPTQVVDRLYPHYSRRRRTMRDYLSRHESRTENVDSCAAF